MKSVTCFAMFFSLLHVGAAQPAGLSARAVLTAQRTCHSDNEDYEEFKMDIFLANTGTQPLVLCDRQSDVSLTPRLATTAENARTQQFVYAPNIDVFPESQVAVQEGVRLKTCRKSVLSPNGTLLVKRGDVFGLLGLHEVLGTKYVGGPRYFTGDVSFRLPGAHLGEWQAIPIDPLRIILPPDGPDARSYVKHKNRNRCEQWRTVKDGSLLP
jgi:hypothetical protein